MHAVIRTYSGEGAKELFDLLEQRKADVESLIRSVKGFVGYSLIRNRRGWRLGHGLSGQGGHGRECAKSQGLDQNAPDIRASAPKVLRGPAILQLK